jgi:hypothetical protein
MNRLWLSDVAMHAWTRPASTRLSSRPRRAPSGRRFVNWNRLTRAGTRAADAAIQPHSWVRGWLL